MEWKFMDTRQAVGTLICTITAAVAFVVVYSVYIGTLTNGNRNNENEAGLYKRSIEYNSSFYESFHDNIIKLMNSENIKDNAKHYSEYPHLPGSKRSEALGREMAKQWKEFGMDKTEIFKYRVLLSFPAEAAILAS